MARRPTSLFPTAEPANETEIWDRVVSGVQAENAAGSIWSADYVDPSRAAQANEISRRVGLPAALVEADVPGYQAQAHRQAASAQARENPTYARMMSNPRFAAAATGDSAVPRIAQWVANAAQSVTGFGGFGRTANGWAMASGERLIRSFDRNPLGDFAVTAWNTANAGAAGALNATYDLLTLRTFGAQTLGEQIQDQLRDDIRQHGAPTTERGREIARSFGIDPDHPEQAPAELDPVRRYLQQAQQISTQTAAAHRVRTGNEYIDAALNGLESVPLQLTAIGAAAAGRPDVALTLMATITGGQAYGEAQAAGLSPARSLIYAGTQGGLEAAGEMLPVFRFADDAARGSGFFRTLMGQFLTEVPGEQFTQHLQDFNTWAAIEANQGKTFGEYLAERPRVARDTLIATIAAVGLQTAAGHAVARAARRAREGQTTLEMGRSLDELMAHAAESPTRAANPSDFEEVLSGVLQDTANENLYIPAAQVRALFQTPEEMAADTFWGDYAPQVTEAELLNGDVVVPLATAVTHLAGTPQWEALKDHVRTSGGGMSRAEADEAGIAFMDALRESGEQLTAELDAERALREPVEKVHEAMRDKLLHAGYRLDAANQLAAQFASRQATRAQRLGQALTGTEADAVEVRQVLPANLARAITAAPLPDAGLRSVIEAMRAKKAARSDRARFGPSLIEFLASRGGIEDIGGELKHMGFATLSKGVAKKGQKKLIRQRSANAPLNADGKPVLESADHSYERALEAAVDAGYFPEVDAQNIAEEHGVSSVTPEHLFDALRAELAGKPRYANDNSTQGDYLREAAQELYNLLDQQGVDPDKATDAEIARTVAQYQAERSRGSRELDQPAYHGSPHIFDKFTTDAMGTGEGAQAYGWGLYFAGKKELGAYYRTKLAGYARLSFSGEHVPANLQEITPELRAWMANAYKALKVDLSAGAGFTAQEVEGAAKSIGPYALRRAFSVARDQELSGGGGIEQLRTSAEGHTGLAERMAREEWNQRDRLEELITGRVMLALAESGDLKMEKPGRLYEVEIPEDNELLHWDRPLNKQPENVREAIREALNRAGTSEKEIAEILFDDGDVAKVTGEALYRKLTDFMAEDSIAKSAFGEEGLIKRADELASKLLHDAGIAGIKFLNGASRAQGEGDYNFVVFDDSLVSINAYEQSYGDGPRGRITFTSDGRSVIDLFEARDLSTFIHETGHLYLEELKQDAAIGAQMDTPEGQQLAADYETVKKWFAENGHVIGDDGTIPTEAHEMWARGFERYAMEGKAPSSGLKRAFEAFRSWLLTIYKNVTRLKSPITPEIRDVMDRLMATDEEIAAAKDEQNIKLGFTSAVEAGMTEAEYAAYTAAATEATGDAHTALLKKVMATVRAARTKEYRGQEAEVRAQVAETIDKQPVFRALAMLRGKDAKLDKQFLIDSYGALDVFPPSVPPIYSDKNTVHPDVIAEEAGFTSGDEMIRSLIDHETHRKELRAADDKRSPRQVAIDEATQAAMAERYGDPLKDGSIEEEARAIIHNEKQGEVLATELRALARQTGRKPTPYRIAREWANEKIAAGQVASVASGSAIQRYLRAAAKAGRAFEQALAKGDKAEAFKHKQSQMLNNALVSASREAKDRIDVAVRRLGKLAKAKTRASMDQDYLDRIHSLLEQVELRPRSQKSLDEQQGYEAWAREQQEAGIDLVKEPSFAASLGTTHWSRLSVEQLIGLDDTVQQIAHLGRLKQTLLDGQERRNFEEIIAEAENAAGQLPPKPPSDLMEPSFGERLSSKVSSFDAALLKIETVIDWLDSKKSAGVFNRIVFKPIADAQTRAADMFADYMGKLNDALAQVPKKTLRRWGDRVTPGELLNRETGNPYTLTRQQLVSMALNMGNEGNAQRLTDGYGWNEEAVMAVLNQELSPEEWNYVQSVWDIIDGLWPHIETLEKNVNGVAPEKVEARPLETSAGTLRGGYFPAVYDSTKDYAAERNAARESDLFETTYTRATTRASSTKDRSEKVSRPILLNLGVITRHIGEVTHDIAYREAVMNADKFLTHPRVMKAVDSTLGPEIRKQFRPWLKFVANQWAMERAGNEGVGAFMNKLRTNTTVVGMGYRFSTMLMQLAGYSNSFEVVGAKWVSAAVVQTSKHPVEMFRFVMERSGEMRHRMDTLDRDIDQGIRRLAGKANPLTEAKRFAYHGIGYMDRVVVIPTWIGAYNKALVAGSTEEEAIYEADKAVRQSQGAGAAKDMAAVQRGTGKWGEALKLTTMFYSYLSAVWQRQRTLGRDIRAAKPKDLPGIMARAWWLIVLPPVLSELMGGRGPDDDEDWAAWAFKQMLFQGLGPIPVIRDVARPAWDKAVGNKAFDYQLSPIQRAGQSVVNVAGDLGRVVRGEDTAHATRDTMEALGYWTGLVPGQVASATQFLVDVGNGEADPQSVGDWYTGLTTGRVPAH